MLTKLDGDTRGGAALSVRAVTGKPIKFAGVGEKLEDIEAFHPDRMASRILGMGDVLTLIEKAEQTLDRKKAAEMADKPPPEPLHPDGLPRADEAAQGHGLHGGHRRDARHERQEPQRAPRLTKRPWPAPRPSSVR